MDYSPKITNLLKMNTRKQMLQYIQADLWFDNFFYCWAIWLNRKFNTTFTDDFQRNVLFSNNGMIDIEVVIDE